MNRKITKICFVISSLRAGGAERVVSTLANSFEAKGSFDVSIVTINEANPFYELVDNIQLISLDNQNNKNPVLNTKTRIKQLIIALKTIKPTIIISFNTTTSCEAIIAARYVNTPIIISERANPKTSAPNMYWKLLRRITFPLANHLVCQTEASKSYYTWVKNKSVIHNPVIVSNLEIKPQKKVILGVGSLIYIKGFDLLIDAFIMAIKISKDKDWKLVILGEGPERQNLEQKISKSGYQDNIILPGKVTNISYYYSTSSIFTLSSRSEGMPNVLLEALSFGMPSIAFDCEFGPSEILKNGEIGLLAKNGDVNDFCDKLKLLMDNKTIRNDFAYKAELRAKDYTLERITKKWTDLLYNI